MTNENAKPITSEEIESIIAGKQISYEDISRERSEMPSTWYVDKGDPIDVVTYEQPYAVVTEEMHDNAIYKLKIQLDREAFRHTVALLRKDDTSAEFKPAPSVPNGLLPRAIEKLNLK